MNKLKKYQLGGATPSNPFMQGMEGMPVDQTAPMGLEGIAQPTQLSAMPAGMQSLAMSTPSMPGMNIAPPSPQGMPNMAYGGYAHGKVNKKSMPIMNYGGKICK